MKDKELIKNIAEIIKKTEKEIKKMYDESSFEKPIKNDIENSLKMMAYSNIKTEVKKYIKCKKGE